MKNLIFFLFTVMIFSISSCTWAGRGDFKFVDASTMHNKTGNLVSKKITDYDAKYGYEVSVWNRTKDSLFEYTKVFVPKSTYERLPEPNDTIQVVLEYIEGIEYGTRDGSPSLWDARFNLCTGDAVRYYYK